MKQFSVCMSVYKNDNPNYLIQALDSIINQTLVPTEIVLVEDGPVTEELEKIIIDFERRFSILKVVREPINKGLGNALNTAISHAKYDIIARMDSDDISHPERFEKQISFLENNPDIDLVGGVSAKFEKSIDEIIGYKQVKLKDFEIKKELQKRCPFSHVTIMAKKDAILKAGGYIEIFNQEDYYLWARMALNKCIFANMNEVLVYVRISGFGERRGGLKYFKNEMFLQNFLLKSSIISVPRYIKHISTKFLIQVVMTSSMRQFAYKTLLKIKSSK